MTKKPIVVGIGEALWDVLPSGKQLGGAPANFAYHVSQFGLDSRVVSAVGDDELGHEITDIFAQRGLHGIVPTVPYPTGTVLATIDANGIPQYDIREHVAWDNIPFTPAVADLATKTGAVCFGSLAQRSDTSRKTIAAFLDAMPKDALRVFDINLRQNFYTADTISDSIRRCNILKINDEELVAISRLAGWPGIDLKDKCWLLMGKYNLRMLILTCGVNGSYVFSEGRVSYQDTPKVTVADTVGAGDSFTATFVAATLKGLPVEEAHRHAVEVSAFICTQHGAMPLLPENMKF